jgi:hypothetical protein
MMTTSMIEVSALYNKYGVNAIKHIELGDGRYAVSRKTEEKKHYNHSPIYNAIICGGQLNLIQLKLSLKGRYCIASLKTDSINICSDKELPRLMKTNTSLKNPSLGKRLESIDQNSNYSPLTKRQRNIRLNET